MFDCYGLVNRAANKPVPLKSISVDVEFKGFVADVVSTLVYKNEEENPIETLFAFPMDSDAAVYKFEATVDGKTIVAEVKEKQEARDTYDDAISSGQEAFLLEQDESSSDVFTCTVGNIPPKQEATVGFAFVMELQLEADDAVRFVLPAVLNPRYTPADFEHGQVTQQVPRVPVSEVPYTLELNASIQYPYGIIKVDSNSTITPLQYLTSDKTSAKLSLDHGHQFNKDVELLIYYSDVHKPSICLESGIETAKTGTLMGDAVLMLNFCPSFPENTSQSNKGEFIFLVDRSGSMGSPMSKESKSPQRISSAKETLLFLLKSLPLGCYFNIYGFGSYFKSFFPESNRYTQDSMEKALKEVESMDASFGGTEILQPLEDIYKKACIPGYPRQLFVFTDGEVGNTIQVISLVKRNAGTHRCFSFGIGEGASTALVKGIANAASGTARFITGKERMQPKVLQSLKCALQSSVKDITVKWQLPFGVNASLLSKAPLVMFKNQRSIIYAQLKGKLNKKADGHASVKYTFEDEKFKETLQFRLEPDKNSRLTVHHLAAKSMIKELEEEHHENSDVVKKKVTAVSLQAGIISSHTAFVAVNKELNQPIKGPLIRRDIPLREIELASLSLGRLPTKSALNSSSQLNVFALKSCSLGQVETKSAPKRSSQLNAFALKSCSLGQVETKSAPKRSSQLNVFALKSCSLGQVEANSAPKRLSQLNANESKSFSLRPIRTKSAPNSSSQLNVIKLESLSIGQLKTKSALNSSSQLNVIKLESLSLGRLPTKSALNSSSQLNANESKSFSVRPIRTKSTPNSSSQLNEKSHTFMDLDLPLCREVFPEAASDPCARSIPYERASEKSHTFMDLDLLLRGEVFPEAASDPCARSIPYERASVLKKKDSLGTKKVKEERETMRKRTTNSEQSSPVVKLISLQNADGSWKLDKEFAALMALSEKELSSKIPKQEIDNSVWATVLAIVWLDAFGAEQKDECELLVEKALTWVKGHAGSYLKECCRVASDLLKTPFKPEIFGL